MAIRKRARGLIAAACTAVLLSLLPSPSTLGSSPLDLDPQRVRWSRLLFEASHGLNSARTEVRLAPIPAAGLESSLLAAGADGPRPPLPDAGALLMVATLSTSTKLPLFSDKTWKTRVWFLPGNASALQRTRLKIGKEPDKKIFRYFPEGVRRVRAEPEDSDEAERPPEAWTKIRSDFYAYGPARAGCRDVSDPSALFYVISAADMSAGDPPLALCVFNKKTLYHAELRAAGTESLRVGYMRRRGGIDERIDKEIDALKIVLSTRADESAERKPEPFEFFEMRGDIEVYIDAASRLPVQVRGTVKNVGEATLLLTEADIAPRN